MNRDFILGLAEKINLNFQLREKLNSICENEAENIILIETTSSLNNVRPFLDCIKRDPQNGPMICLASALSVCEKTKELYNQKNISDEIFYDTMSDISIWANTAKSENDVDGLLEINWIRHSIYFNLFRVGRLQYQFYKTNFLLSGLSFYQFLHAPLKNHSNVINIHIPQGERLDFQSCADSLESARKFYEEFFPEYKYNGFVCDSWLLYADNKKFMDENSNIIKFSDLFDEVIKTKSGNAEMMRRLWGVETSDKKIISTFPEKTDLQKRAKQYLLNGGKTGNGYGFIL